MEEDKQYIKADGNYFIYRLIPGTDWLVTEEIPAFNLENSYQEIQTNILYYYRVQRYPSHDHLFLLLPR